MVKQEIEQTLVESERLTRKTKEKAGCNDQVISRS